MTPSIPQWILFPALLASVFCHDWSSTLETALRRRENSSLMEESLSRRKRFVTFTEGSSIQLVLCLQQSAVIPIGDIFLIGETLALAWEVPQEPVKYAKEHSGFKRRVDEINTLYDAEKNRTFLIPKSERPLIPVFAKRSVESEPDDTTNRNRVEPEVWIDRKRMHDSVTRRISLKLEPDSAEFHRHSRKGLYQKIEVLLNGFGTNGRECVLRMLCEAGAARAQRRQSSVVEEMMRAVFTLHEGQEFEEDYTRKYDVAYKAGVVNLKNCEKLYPDCSMPTSGPLFP